MSDVEKAGEPAMLLCYDIIADIYIAVKAH